jgi:hypothetical protein
MNNFAFVVFYVYLTKCTVEKAKSQFQIFSGSFARRELIPPLTGYISYQLLQLNWTKLEIENWKQKGNLKQKNELV